MDTSTETTTVTVFSLELLASLVQIQKTHDAKLDAFVATSVDIDGWRSSVVRDTVLNCLCVPAECEEFSRADFVRVFEKLGEGLEDARRFIVHVQHVMQWFVEHDLNRYARCVFEIPTQDEATLTLMMEEMRWIQILNELELSGIELSGVTLPLCFALIENTS